MTRYASKHPMDCPTCGLKFDRDDPCACKIIVSAMTGERGVAGTLCPRCWLPVPSGDWVEDRG